MSDDFVYTLPKARATVLSRYTYILELYHGTLRKREPKAAERYCGELRGLAHALGALGYKENLPA
jgi:hypothetical protein